MNQTIAFDQYPRAMGPLRLDFILWKLGVSQ